MEKEVNIYKLSDPITGDVRYIGKSKNLKSRLYQHCFVPFKNDKKDLWVKSLQELGLNPIMEVIEKCSEGMGCEREFYHINAHIQNGAKLFNKVLVSGKLERISFVVPDGTRDKLKAIAIKRGVKVNEIVVDIILNALKQSEVFKFDAGAIEAYNRLSNK